MVTISLCMIVKNEEDTIGRCLDCVQDLADEIIVVDTGSSDQTKEIVLRYTNKVYDFPWTEDFSAARNFSFEKATMDYILWLDADDIIQPWDVEKLKTLKERLPLDIDVVMMRYNTGFDPSGNVTFSCFRERLSKRGCGFKWREPVHEYLDTWGKRISIDISITHSKPKGRRHGRNIMIYEKILEEGGQLTTRGMYYYARELKDHARYEDAKEYFIRFLDSDSGWFEDKINACGELAKCYLYENNQKEALRWLLRSFYYDLPRAEICCQLGYLFKSQGKLRQAAFWFELILKLSSGGTSLGFIQQDCWGYIPCLELAVVYNKLGETKKAASFNELAAEYKPDSLAVKHNRNYFRDKLISVNEEK